MSFRIWVDTKKVGKYVAVECEMLHAHTQGTSLKDAEDMMVDWLREMLNDSEFKVAVDRGKEGFWLVVDDIKPILALALEQARNFSNVSVAAIVEKTGHKSRNQYYQYKSGKHEPSLSTFSELLIPMGFDVAMDIVPIKKARQA